MLDLILGQFGGYIAAAGAAIIAALGLYFKGRSDAATKADHKRAKEALETHDRINEAEIAEGPDDARAWLRDHADRLRRDRKP